ncbi:uncharacterized protein TNCV_3193541 [Trichonephila clavipes]|nr:uncharacterized protein TNCV_3193541 [Trichonephila clavipes]
MLVNLATRFFNNSDTRRIITNFQYEVWKDAIREEMSSLGIPVVLQDDVITLIKPMNLEVTNWMEDHDEIISENQECFLEFCFNADGTVDRIKTANLLIHSKRLSVTTRFMLACQYWSSWDVLTFFKKLRKREKFQIKKKYSKVNKKLNQHEENVLKWIELYDEDCISESQPWGWCYEYFNWTDVSLQSRLLDDLPEEYCKILLDETFEEMDKEHIGRFCLSRMSADHREQLLIRFPLKVLRIYLFWPPYHYFLDAVSKVWNLLTEKHFTCLLHIIICQKIVNLWEDFDYVYLLRQFWHRSPDRLKQCVKETNIFEILMEIVKHGFHPKNIPRYFLHKQCFTDNVVLCMEMTYDLVAIQ